MKFTLFTLLASLSLASAATISKQEPKVPKTLRYTALIGDKASASKTSNSTDPNLKASKFQCWELDAHFESSQQPGTNGASNVQLPLGSLANGTYTYFAEKSANGLHNAPYPQYVIILTGSATVTLPNNTAKAVFKPGYGTIAADLPSVSKLGHATTWAAGTSVLQIPFKDGVPPKHKVIVKDGACKGHQNLHF